MVQHDIVWNDPDANFARLAPQIARAVGGGADVVLLTETFSVGFGFDDPDFVTEPEGGPSSRFLAAAAREHGVWVGGSCPEIRADAPDDDQRPSTKSGGPRQSHPVLAPWDRPFVEGGPKLDDTTAMLVVRYAPNGVADETRTPTQGSNRSVPLRLSK